MLVPLYHKRDIPADLQEYFEPAECGRCHVCRTVGWAREVRRVLRDDGVFWLNYGDCYAGTGGENGNAGLNMDTAERHGLYRSNPRTRTGTDRGNLMLMPHRIALALQADGWIVRQDLVWCLSGGTMLYAKTQTSEGPMMLKDLVRLRPDTVRLWNGLAWTQVIQWRRNKDRLGALELVLRSGERIGCTPEHRWPMRWPVAAQITMLPASQIEVGDCIATSALPESLETDPAWITDDAFWFAGIYLAEGSRSGTTIQLSGHANESQRWERVRQLAEWYGASARLYIRGKMQAIHIDHAQALSAVLEHLLRGRTAKDKGLSPAVWQLSNGALKLIAQGYLEGDASPQVDRWRLGFTRNYKLEADLRCLAARLGATLTLKPTVVRNQTGKFPAFRGEWRWQRSGNPNEKDRAEVVEIRRSRAREFWDITVADEPHLFALASGVLTHNSKPNPMPESVNGWRWQREREEVGRHKDFMADKRGPGYFNDQSGSPDLVEWEYGPDYELRRGSWRHTTAHEHVFMLVKGMQYWSNQEAVRETNTPGTIQRLGSGPVQASGKNKKNIDIQRWAGQLDYEIPSGRNPRSVLHIPTAPYRGAHYATYPPALIAPLILATCPRWCCPVCGQGWAPMVESGNPRHSEEYQNVMNTPKSRAGVGIGRNDFGTDRTGLAKPGWREFGPDQSRVLGYRPTCDHPHTQAEAVPGIVCDPFVGSGTSVMVARQLLRRGIGFDISRPYLREQAKTRIESEPKGKWKKILGGYSTAVQQEKEDVRL